MSDHYSWQLLNHSSRLWLGQQQADRRHLNPNQGCNHVMKHYPQCCEHHHHCQKPQAIQKHCCQHQNCHHVKKWYLTRVPVYDGIVIIHFKQCSVYNINPRSSVCIPSPPVLLHVHVHSNVHEWVVKQHSIHTDPNIEFLLMSVTKCAQQFLDHCGLAFI